jgi:hypothetical protein
MEEEIKEQFETRMREEGKKKFEVRLFTDEKGFHEKQIYIDGEHFDWGIDEESFDWARKQGPAYFAAIQKDIAKHFLESLSEMVGRPITIQEFATANKTGWI